MAGGKDGVRELMVSGVHVSNPVLVQALGVCSALAVTRQVGSALVMGVSLMLVTGLSSMLVSLLRDTIPPRVRLMVQMRVISVFVIVMHLFLDAHFYETSRAFGPYFDLIITNCIVLGRTEGYALRHPAWPSLVDGVANGAGYALVLVVVALLREGLGEGALLGWRWAPAGYVPSLFMLSAPGAFLTLGALIWLVKGLGGRRAASAS